MNFKEIRPKRPKSRVGEMIQMSPMLGEFPAANHLCGRYFPRNVRYRRALQSIPLGVVDYHRLTMSRNFLCTKRKFAVKSYEINKP